MPVCLSSRFWRLVTNIILPASMPRLLLDDAMGNISLRVGASVTGATAREMLKKTSVE